MTELGPEDAAIFETSVVPRYLSHFGERLVAMLASGPDARVCHVHCRTGYPDRALLERLPQAHVHGCDPSEHAIELARAKAAALERRDGAVFDYRVARALPLPFPDGAFSHAFVLHPLDVERGELLEELGRIVAPLGQAVVGVPLRGSFVEVADLLRECALKHELATLASALDASASRYPTDDVLERELERAGFEHVQLDVRVRTLKFSGGRAFLEDPITRLVLVPELRASLGAALDEARPLDPLEYVRDAIDKYWSDGTFGLTVNMGVLSGRRRAA